MKCLILWSNDKEKKMQQNKNQKYCGVLYLGMLLNGFTRCNPMPADTTRHKMIACCFLCANWICLFSEFLEFADA